MKKARQATSPEAAAKSLNELEARFNHWRQNKAHSRESIPLDLLQAARALTDHLGHTCVKSRLGLSGEQLKRGESPNQSIKPAETQQPAVPQHKFVKAAVNNAPAAQTWRIELHSPTGAVVTVSGLRNKPMEIINQLLENIDDCA